MWLKKKKNKSVMLLKNLQHPYKWEFVVIAIISLGHICFNLSDRNGDNWVEKSTSYLTVPWTSISRHVENE